MVERWGRKDQFPGSSPGNPTFNIPCGNLSFDDLFEIAAEGGADDVIEEEDYFEIIGPVEVFKTVFDMLKAASIVPESSGLRMDPNQEIELDLESTVQVMKVIDNSGRIG